MLQIDTNYPSAPPPTQNPNSNFFRLGTSSNQNQNFFNNHQNQSVPFPQINRTFGRLSLSENTNFNPFQGDKEIEDEDSANPWQDMLQTDTNYPSAPPPTQNPNSNSFRLGTSSNFETVHLQMKCIYLTKSPYDNRNPFLEAEDIIFFLATFDDNFVFSQTQKSRKQINDEVFEYKMNISYREFNDLITPLFVIRYQKSGNYFVIQIVKHHQSIQYEVEQHPFKKMARDVYIYVNPRVIDIYHPKSQDYHPNKGMKELSDFYNNKSVNPEFVKLSTSFQFYSIAPFDNKTVRRHYYESISPDDSIEGIVKAVGGHLFRFLTKQKFDPKNYSFGIFAWFSPYFEKFATCFPIQDCIATIEIDATFRALNPYVICIPHLIFHNVGVSIGILAAPSESHALYSLLFESLKAFDAYRKQRDSQKEGNGGIPNEINEGEQDFYNPEPLLPFFKEKFYLTDAHKSFGKLSNDYGLKNVHCYVHFIRQLGANSRLAFLATDILYTRSEHEWKDNVLRYQMIFKLLLHEEIKTIPFDGKLLSKEEFIHEQPLQYILESPSNVKNRYLPLYEMAQR